MYNLQLSDRQGSFAGNVFQAEHGDPSANPFTGL